jgi:hypothetical protein
MDMEMRLVVIALVGVDATTLRVLAPALLVSSAPVASTNQL